MMVISEYATIKNRNYSWNGEDAINWDLLLIFNPNNDIKLFLGILYFNELVIYLFGLFLNGNIKFLWFKDKNQYPLTKPAVVPSPNPPIESSFTDFCECL